MLRRGHGRCKLAYPHRNPHARSPQGDAQRPKWYISDCPGSRGSQPYRVLVCPASHIGNVKNAVFIDDGLDEVGDNFKLFLYRWVTIGIRYNHANSVPRFEEVRQ